MGLKYITGLVGSGKTEFCKNNIKKTIEKYPNKKIIYIVPEQFTLNGEYVITELLGGAMLNVEVMSFKRLAYNIFSEVGLEDLPILDSVGKSIVLRKVINSLYDNKKLKYFNKAVTKKGFIERISATVSEFVHYLITPEKLDIIIKNIKDATNDENAAVLKFEDLKLIFTEYNNYIAEKYISMENTPDYLAKYLQKSKSLKEADVYIDSFNGFSPQEVSVIRELLILCEDVYICLAFSEKSGDVSEESSFCEPAFAKRMLDKICTENKIEVKTVFDGGDDNKRQKGVLKEFSQQYLRVEDKVINAEDDNSLVLINADTKYSELKYIGNEINRLVRNGAKYSDIGVILGNAEYLPNIKSMFEKFDIAFFADNKVSAANQPLAQLILSFLRIYIYNFRYEDILKIIKTGFVNNYEEISEEDFFEFENYVLQYSKSGIDKYKKEWVTKCSPNAEKVRKILYELFTDTNCRLDLKKEYSTKKISEKIYNFLEILNVRNTLAQWANIENDSLINTAVYKQIWGITADIIGKIEEILNEKISLKDYCDVFSAALESTSVGFIPSKLDGVTVGDIDRTRFANIKYLFIAGANDGFFPSSVKDLGFISDKERVEARKKGIDFASESEKIIRHNNFLIYSAFSVPTERLYISYASALLVGDALKPAEAVKKVIRRCKGLQKINVNMEKVYIASKSTTFEAFLKKAKLGDINDVRALWGALKEKYPEYEQGIKASILKLEQRANLSNDVLDKLYKGKDFFSSVSKIETFNSCPFKYFAKYILKLSERKSAEISALETGNTQHELLCNLLTAIKKDNWEKMSQIDINEYMNEIIEKYKSDNKDDYSVYEISGRNGHIFEQVERIVKITASAIVSQIKNNGVRPLELETSFSESKESEYSSYNLPLDDGTNVNFTGKIDRVDVFNYKDRDYIRIIDYKSSEKKLNKKDIELGIQIQLIMYLDIFLSLKNAESRKKDGRTYNPAGAFYMEVHDNELEKSDLSEHIDKEVEKMREGYKVKGVALKNKEIYGMLNASTKFLVEEGEFQELFDNVKNGVKKSCRQIKNGNIKVEPCKSEETCKYCEFYPLCSKDSIEDISGGN